VPISLQRLVLEGKKIAVEEFRKAAALERAGGRTGAAAAEQRVREGIAGGGSCVWGQKKTTERESESGSGRGLDPSQIGPEWAGWAKLASAYLFG
jgi:hypothetical protein